MWGLLLWMGVWLVEPGGCEPRGWPHTSWKWKNLKCVMGSWPSLSIYFLKQCWGILAPAFHKWGNWGPKWVSVLPVAKQREISTPVPFKFHQSHFWCPSVCKLWWREAFLAKVSPSGCDSVYWGLWVLASSLPGPSQCGCFLLLLPSSAATSSVLQGCCSSVQELRSCPSGAGSCW